MMTYSCAAHNLLLAGIATTPSGKQTILKEGAIPSIVCMLGSRYPRVVSAAVSTVRNLSSPQDFAVSRALFAAGASTMLVHVIASNTGRPSGAQRLHCWRATRKNMCDNRAQL
jgi:hypothetical protein